jgi:hypothetical protein
VDSSTAHITTQQSLPLSNSESDAVDELEALDGAEKEETCSIASAILISEASSSEPSSTGFSISLPDCWSTEQYNYFKKENNWLIVCDGKLGCVLCRVVSIEVLRYWQ